MTDLRFGLLMALIFGLMMNEFDLIEQLMWSVRYGFLFESDSTLI